MSVLDRLAINSGFHSLIHLARFGDIYNQPRVVSMMWRMHDWEFAKARDQYFQESRWILCCDASTAIERINRHADAAAESVRRSHGQHFRHLKQWINDKGEHA